MIVLRNPLIYTADYFAEGEAQAPPVTKN
jgi:hypothetical protein